MRKNLLPILLITMVMPWSACDDIIERDLTGRSVTLIAPSDGVVTTASVQTFWWEELDGALSYDLHVVTTGFDSIVQMVLDTTVTATQFQFTLWPGQFQWRVRAVNGSSQSLFTTYSLTVDTTSDLSGQTVVPVSPSSGIYTNQPEQTFTWQPLASAVSYRLQLSNDGFVSGANVLDTLVTGAAVNLQLDEEGTYHWKVRAETSASVSSYSQVRHLTIDLTPPATVTLWLPEDDVTIPVQAVSFAWQPVSDSGSPVFDSLYVYSDSLITLHAAYRGVQGSVTDSLGPGVFFWRVRAFDEAGNTGEFTLDRKLTVF